MESQYTMMEIEEDMAHRIAYQTIFMKGVQKSCTPSVNRRLGFLPKEWLVVSEEWCKDHNISILHGAMALLHLWNIFGLNWSAIELRDILDEALEKSKKIKIVKQR